MTSVLHHLVWAAPIAEGLAFVVTGAYLGLRQKPSSATVAACETPACQSTASVARTAHDPVVYTTSGNRYYHRRSCPYVRSSRTPMRRSQAWQRYRPCGRCKPPHVKQGQGMPCPAGLSSVRRRR